MNKYGCIGEHLKHSFSKEIHNMIEDYKYDIWEIPRDSLHDFMTKRDFDAINVTIPYKQDVIPYLHYIHDTAKQIGAVNTIVNRDGKLYGYNTDFSGMTALIKKADIDISNKKVLVLGTGGTSKTAVAVAKSMSASQIIVVSRTAKDGCITYTDAEREHNDADVIINTTPCGMYPNTEGIAIDLDKYPNVTGIIDAVYNPLRTPLVRKALKKGIKAEGGLYMLVAQAVHAAQWFIGKEYPRDVINSVYDKILAQKQNIVLTGMPACGKTTVGNLLSMQTGRPLIDTDSIVVNEQGVEIAEIFEKHGEEHFRNLETDAIKQASAQSGCIISTGGGAVLRDENIDALKANGIIYFIDRPLKDLMPTDNRPLADTADKIAQRYHERYDIYCSTADVKIDANTSPEEVANRIKGAHNP